eukprot:g33642.t1
MARLPTSLSLAFAFQVAFLEDKRPSIHDDLEKSQCWNALRSTGFFVGFVVVLLIISLNFRPGHKESLDRALQSEESAVRWLNDLLDVQHRGLNAISFAIACLTLAGVLGWAMYTAYGLAAMPFDWLRGKQTPSEQRQDVETSIAGIRDTWTVYSAFISMEGVCDRRTMLRRRLQREHKNLMQHNYRLQEVEQRAGACIPQLLRCLIPFRLLIGVVMMSLSLLVVFSLLLTLERRIYNPADEVYLRLSRVFPVDFVFLSLIVLYIFAATLFGIIALDIRLLCISVYTLRARKSAPQALLVMCNTMAYILLALCVALLTIAPDYTAFGSQRPKSGLDATARCTLRSSEDQSHCQVSVIATFFTQIALSMPIFSIAYFLANWAFIHEWLNWHKDFHMNLIDTPGHVDFTIEVERALRVLDGAVLICCGVGGVQSQTITVDRQMKRYEVPRVVFINKLDRYGSDPFHVLGQIRQKLGLTCQPLQLPIGEEDNFIGICDLVSQRASFFEGKDGISRKFAEIPEAMKEKVAEARSNLLETLADIDDEFAEVYLEHDDVPEDAIHAAIRRTTIARTFCPLFMGSAYKNKGDHSEEVAKESSETKNLKSIPIPSESLEKTWDSAMVPGTNLLYCACGKRCVDGRQLGLFTYYCFHAATGSTCADRRVGVPRHRGITTAAPLLCSPGLTEPHEWQNVLVPTQAL